MLPTPSAAMQKVAPGQEMDVKVLTFWIWWPLAHWPAE